MPRSHRKTSYNIVSNFSDSFRTSYPSNNSRPTRRVFRHKCRLQRLDLCYHSICRVRRTVSRVPTTPLCLSTTSLNLPAWGRIRLLLIIHRLLLIGRVSALRRMLSVLLVLLWRSWGSVISLCCTWVFVRLRRRLGIPRWWAIWSFLSHIVSP